MMNRYSCPVNSNPDDRVYFFYWEDMVEYLRNEVEADGHTYRHNITNWQEKGPKGNKTKATCSLVWMRINQETMMAEVVTRTVTCEDNTVLPTVERVCGKHVYHDWKRAEW